jgi:hypothetical protein
LPVAFGKNTRTVLAFHKLLKYAIPEMEESSPRFQGGTLHIMYLFLLRKYFVGSKLLSKCQYGYKHEEGDDVTNRFQQKRMLIYPFLG